MDNIYDPYNQFGAPPPFSSEFPLQFPEFPGELLPAEPSGEEWVSSPSDTPPNNTTPDFLDIYNLDLPPPMELESRPLPPQERSLLAPKKGRPKKNARRSPYDSDTSRIEPARTQLLSWNIKDLEHFARKLNEERLLSDAERSVLSICRRKIKNRESAFDSRQKKKETLSTLHCEISRLKEENAALQMENMHLKKKTESYEEQLRQFGVEPTLASPRKVGTGLLALLMAFALLLQGSSQFGAMPRLPTRIREEIPLVGLNSRTLMSTNPNIHFDPNLQFDPALLDPKFDFDHDLYAQPAPASYPADADTSANVHPLPISKSLSVMVDPNIGQDATINTYVFEDSLKNSFLVVNDVIQVNESREFITSSSELVQLGTQTESKLLHSQGPPSLEILVDPKLLNSSWSYPESELNEDLVVRLTCTVQKAEFTTYSELQPPFQLSRVERE
jgi:hypothetical protein